MLTLDESHKGPSSDYTLRVMISRSAGDARIGQPVRASSFKAAALVCCLACGVPVIGCSSGSEAPNPEGSPFFVSADLISVNAAPVTADNATTLFSVSIYDGACTDCSGSFRDATVWAGPPGNLTEIAFDDTSHSFREFRSGYSEAYLFRIDAQGRSIECEVAGPSFYSATVSPTPALNAPTTIAWTPAGEAGIYASVSVITPNGMIAQFPPNGIGDDDGEEVVPARSFGDPGKYWIGVLRGHRILQQVNTDFGDRIDCDASVQLNFDFQLD